MRSTAAITDMRRMGMGSSRRARTFLLLARHTPRHVIFCDSRPEEALLLQGHVFIQEHRLIFTSTPRASVVRRIKYYVALASTHEAYNFLFVLGVRYINLVADIDVRIDNFLTEFFPVPLTIFTSSQSAGSRLFSRLFILYVVQVRLTGDGGSGFVFRDQDFFRQPS